MKCETCGKCRAIKLKDEVYSVSCIAHDDFPIHQSHIANFLCDEYVERLQEPPKDNLVITLKCGRDFFMYDKDITCNDDMQRRIGASEGWVEFDGMLFNVNEIAVMAYMG